MRQDDFIALVRRNTRQLWDAVNTLKSLQEEWNALDYGTNLGVGTGLNTGIQPTDVGAVVFSTANAIETLLHTGHATNLAKLL